MDRSAITGSGGTAGSSRLTVVLVSLDPDERLGQLAAALARAGHRPLLVTREDGRPPATAGGVRCRTVAPGLIQVRALGQAGDFFDEFADGVADIVASVEPDVVHTVGWVAGLSVRRTDPVRRVHSFRAPAGAQLDARHFGEDRRRVERAAIGDAQRVLVDSGPGRDILRRLGVPSDRISVVPPGVDLEVFHPPAMAIGRSASGRLVLAAAELDPFTLRAVLRAAPDAELVLLETSGTGSGAPASRERLGTRLRMVHAPDSAQRASVLRSADLLLYRDPPEGARSVPMEAMACGVPVLACCPDSVDAVVPGVTGVDAYGQSPDELARTVRRLLGDPVRWQAMSFGAVDRAASRYGWARVAAETAGIYDELLSRHPVRSPGRSADHR